MLSAGGGKKKRFWDLPRALCSCERGLPSGESICLTSWILPAAPAQLGREAPSFPLPLPSTRTDQGQLQPLCPSPWEGLRSTCEGHIGRLSPNHRTTECFPTTSVGKRLGSPRPGQGLPGIASDSQKLGGAGQGLPLSLQRKGGPADTLISDFQLPEPREDTFLLR